MKKFLVAVTCAMMVASVPFFAGCGGDSGSSSSSSQTQASKYGPNVPSNIPAPHNITRRAVNFLKQNYNVKEVIQQDDARYLATNDKGHHFMSMVKVRLNIGVKVARVNVHFSPDGKTYYCEAKLRNPNADGT